MAGPRPFRPSGRGWVCAEGRRRNDGQQIARGVGSSLGERAMGAGARRSARFANRVATSPAPALAMKPIAIPADQDRIEITTLGEYLRGRGDSAAGRDRPAPTASAGRMSGAGNDARHQPELDRVRADQPDRQADRALAHRRALQHHRLGRGVARSRRAPHRGCDALRRLTSPSASRATAPTFSASRWSPARPSPTSPSCLRPLRAHLPMEAARLRASKIRDRQLFNGIMLGLTGLLAIFLTAIFAANHKAIFPSCRPRHLVRAGLSLRGLRLLPQAVQRSGPEDNAIYRAAAEAGMAREPGHLPAHLPAARAVARLHPHAASRCGWWRSCRWSPWP